jgi:hypothetical protein
MKISKNLLLIILILSSSMLAFGQRSWSVSISYSPRVEHRGSYIRDLFYYPLSPVFISDFRPTDHFSVSLGISFHYQKDRTESLYFVGTPTPPSYCILRTYLYEIPLQFNLHIFDRSKKLDPFIKTSIRYTFSHESGEIYYPGIQRNSYFNDNYVLWDFGAGLDINISETISIISQISYGIGLKHYFDDFKYFEPQAGLRYTF